MWRWQTVWNNAVFSTAVGHRCFLDSSSVVAMEVRFMASGERLLTLEPGELEQKTAQDLKRLVAPLVGVSRFRQRLYRACDGCEIGDEEVCLEGRIVLLVVLPFVSDDFEKMKMMMKAVEEDDLVALEGTLSCPCDPNFVYEEESGVSVRMPNGTFLPTRQRGAPLQSAASLGLGGAVRLLLEAGARCDSLLDHLWTPLRGAVSGNHFHVVEMLLQAGADADFYNPLFLAAQKGYLRCAELLLESGAALDQVGHDGGRSDSFDGRCICGAPWYGPTSPSAWGAMWHRWPQPKNCHGSRSDGFQRGDGAVPSETDHWTFWWAGGRGTLETSEEVVLAMSGGRVCLSIHFAGKSFTASNAWGD